MRSKILVNPKWLFENYKKANISILDSTWFMPSSGRNGYKEFLDNRIPNSQHFDIDKISNKSIDLPFMLPSPQQFEKQVGELGISNNQEICIYDTNNLAACRVYEMFKIFGHKNVRILDGGFNNWKLNYETLIEKGTVKAPAKQQYKANYIKEKVKTLADIQNNKGEFEVVDARPPGRFCGIEKEPKEGLRSGSIPKSKNVFASQIFNEKGLFKTNEELEALFKGVNLKENVTCTCATGVTACILMFALELIGKDPKQIYLYDGAWTEYGSKVSI